MLSTYLMTAVLASVLLLCAIGAVAQQPMCGQSLSPTQANLGQPIQGFALVATPLRSVANPRFQIQFPSRDFFADGAASRGLKVTISGCFSGTDAQATIYNDTVTTRADLFTGGIVSPDVACTVTVESTDKVAFPNDLKAPSEVFGNFIVPDSDYFVSFIFRILTNSLTVIDESVNTDDRTAKLVILDSFNKISFNGVSGGAAVTTPSSTLDSLVVKTTPNVAVDVGSSFPSDKQIQLAFSQDIFPVTSAALTATVSGCTSVSSAAVTIVNSKTITFVAGAVSLTNTECVITVNRGNAGDLVLPAANELSVEIELRDTAGFRLPRLFGRSASQPTNAMSSIQFSTDPASAGVRTALNAVSVQATPKNALAATDYVQVTLRNVIFRNFPANGSLNGLFVLDVTGCASSANTGLALNTDSLTSSFAQLTTSAAVNFDAGSTAACTFTVRVATGAAVTMSVYEAATTIRATVATSSSATFGAVGATNYASVDLSIYSMTDLSFAVSSQKAGDALTSIKLQGTPANNILSTEAPQIRVVIPKILSIENTKDYNIEVSGCASYGPADITVPDDVSCSAVFSVTPTGAITAGTPCTVSIRTATGSNGGLFRNPAASGTAIQFSLQTFKQGNVLDFGNDAVLAYNTTGSNDNDNNTPVASAAPSSVVNAVALSIAAILVAALQF
eukprot:ANDGO_00889.mRNA.1 hypothetical protein